MIDPKSVTLIIPHLGATKEQEYALDQCVTSLKETVPDIKIILANNGTDDYCQHKDGMIDVSTIWVEEQGQCKAVSAATATVDTFWILVTNDDMIYAPNWWEKLTEPIGQIGQIGQIGEEIRCISPKLIEPRPGAPTFEVYFCGGAGGDFDKQKWLEFARNYQGQGIRTGFNLPFLIKKELWDLIGGYDVVYDPFSSNSDSDLEYKIRLAGVQPYQNTNCVVYHFGETSRTSAPENRPYWEKNWKYFISKWGFERASSPTIWTADFEIPMDKLKYKPSWINKYVT